MKLTIKPEFKAFIPPLKPEERERLRASLLAEGCRDPIIVWRGIVVDGHNRYEICTEHDIPFATQPLDLPDEPAVLAWMFAHQVGRRNLSPDQITMLAVLRGVTRPASERALNEREARALAEHDPERAAKVLSGQIRSIRIAYNAAVRNGKIPGVEPPARRPRAPRGPADAPTTPHVPEAHEIRGVSTLVGPDGELKGQWTKTGLAGGETEELPPDFLVRKVSTMTGPDGTTRVKWTSAEREKIDQWNAFLVASREHAAQYRGLAGVTEPPKHDLHNTLALYPFGDPHIGMLSWAPETGEHNDLTIAIDRMHRAMALAVDSAPPSEEAWLINLGDMLHAQNSEQRTPKSGHKLDVDGRYAKVWRACLEMCRELTHQALKKHGSVKWFNLPGNHDPEVAAMLAMWLTEAFSAEPRVRVDSAHRPYVYERYGATLIGMTHGDGAPINALPEIMAADAPEDWGATEFHLWLTGHVHHLSRKDFRSCTVETFRILPPSDYWHRATGYRAQRSQHVITLHPEFGEINRSTIDLAMLAR